MNPAQAAEQVVATLQGAPPVVEAVVVATNSDEVPLGERLLVWAESMEGSIGSDELDHIVAAEGRAALHEKKPRTVTAESDGRRIELYLEPHFPPAELVIVGAGHIARPLCAVGALLGYQVIVVDDRPGFATAERFPEASRLVDADFSDPFRDVPLGSWSHLILVTRGHKYDYDALSWVLREGLELGYIGMVGSQRRVRAALEQLVKDGIESAQLRQVYSPIGLDIGAETPEEIAISIMGELVRLRRGGTGASLRDKARVMERWIDRPPAEATPPDGE